MPVPNRVGSGADWPSVLLIRFSHTAGDGKILRPSPPGKAGFSQRPPSRHLPQAPGAVSLLPGSLASIFQVVARGLLRLTYSCHLLACKCARTIQIISVTANKTKLIFVYYEGPFKVWYL